MNDFIRFHANDARLKHAVEVRSAMLGLLRGFFADRGFLEVETPIVCSSPGVEPHLAALCTSVGRRAMYLTTSPEFHMKRLVAVGFEKVFQVTRAFRDGESGDLHNPEFTMVEWYRAGEDHRAIMRDCEDLTAHIGRGLGDRPGDLDLHPPYPRTTFSEAFARAGCQDAANLTADERMLFLAEKVEPLLGREGPEFLVDYPADLASLARLNPEDPSIADRFELYAGGLELANGFAELCDADGYLARCEADLAVREAAGLPRYPVDERYVTMLREGLPPCAGVALGFDRLVMLMTGAASIRDVMPFPLDVA